MRISILYIIFSLLLALPLQADDIYLKNGRVLEGVVLERSDSQIVIEVAAGQMTLPAGMVERIETAPSRLTDFEAREATLAEDDVEGWVALAFWAADNRLDTRSRATFEKVLTLDPGHVVAQEILGQLSDEVPPAPAGWKPPWKLLASGREEFSTPWTLEALAPEHEDTDTGRALARVLSLAIDCRWAEAAWRLSDLLARDAGLPRNRLNSVLFALEVAAHTSSQGIQELFTATEASFLRQDCVAYLKYEGTTPIPWEWQGTLEPSGNTVDLGVERGSGRLIRFAMPFRRPGAVRHIGSNEQLENDVLFEGLLLSLPKAGHARLTWRAVLRGEDPWQEGTPQSLAHLTAATAAEGESREAWAETNALWRNQAASFTRRTALPGSYFTEPHHLRSTVSRDVVRFGVDLEMSESLNLPPSELLFLSLEAQGSPVSFDWLSLSGPVDGTWIARQVAKQSRHRR